MLHKTGRITTGAALYPQEILPGCQGAYPAGKFNQYCPAYSRDMNPAQNTPAQNQQSAKQYKKYEEQVYDDSKIGKKIIDHVC